MDPTGTDPKKDGAEEGTYTQQQQQLNSGFEKG